MHIFSVLIPCTIFEGIQLPLVLNHDGWLSWLVTTLSLVILYGVIIIKLVFVPG